VVFQLKNQQPLIGICCGITATDFLFTTLRQARVAAVKSLSLTESAENISPFSPDQIRHYPSPFGEIFITR